VFAVSPSELSPESETQSSSSSGLSDLIKSFRRWTWALSIIWFDVLSPPSRWDSCGQLHHISDPNLSAAGQGANWPGFGADCVEALSSPFDVGHQRVSSPRVELRDKMTSADHKGWIGTIKKETPGSNSKVRRAPEPNSSSKRGRALF